MPFTTQPNRDKMLKFLETGIVPEEGIDPGDLCFVKYRNEMIAKWKVAPRWTTAHQIYKQMKRAIVGSDYYPPLPEDEAVAYDLAWQVFFNLHVMPYEHKKRLENGDIE